MLSSEDAAAREGLLDNGRLRGAVQGLGRAAAAKLVSGAKPNCASTMMRSATVGPSAGRFGPVIPES